MKSKIIRFLRERRISLIALAAVLLWFIIGVVAVQIFLKYYGG